MLQLLKRLGRGCVRLSNTILLQIIKTLQGVNGLSCYKLSQMIGYPEQNVRYHLDGLCDSEVVEKVGPKYYLVRTAFVHKGTVVCHFPGCGVMFIGCEYYDQCDCRKSKLRECRKVRELPKAIRDILK